MCNKMTNTKIEKIKLFVYLSIFIFPQITNCDGTFRNKNQADESVPLDSKNENVDTGKEISTIKKNLLNDKKIPVNNVSTNLENVEENITSKTAPTELSTYSPTIQNVNGIHIPSINFEAIKRGVYVIMGLSVIVMAYMVFRSFRLNKSHAQMVRKYGVLAHRQDVEMRPLPLDDDDEDDTTVFDASSIISNRLQLHDS